MSGYCGDNGVINSCNKDNTVTVMVAVIVMRKKIHKTLWISINQIEMLCNCVGNYAANTADNNDGSVMVTAASNNKNITTHSSLAQDQEQDASKQRNSNVAAAEGTPSRHCCVVVFVPP